MPATAESTEVPVFTAGKSGTDRLFGNLFRLPFVLWDIAAKPLEFKEILTHISLDCIVGCDILVTDIDRRAKRRFQEVLKI